MQLHIICVKYRGIMEERRDRLLPVCYETWGKAWGALALIWLSVVETERDFWLMPPVPLVLPSVLSLPTACRGHCCYLLCAEGTVATYYVLGHA